MEKNSVKYGVTAGLASVIYSLLLYFTNQVSNVGLGFVGFAIVLYFMWKACQDDRTLQGGFASFREMFSSAFLTFAVAAIFTIGFQYILLTVIDPELAEIQAEQAMEQAIKIVEWAGIEENSKEYEEALENAEKNAMPSLKNSILGYLGALVFGGLISLIFGGAMKKDKPPHIAAREDETEHLVGE
ncbi:MAG: DUF4199 domain-containing protein [Saprospiraceae bacterium]